MATSAALAVTLIPVLMGYLVHGRIPGEMRDSLEKLRALPVLTETGPDPLGEVAAIRIADGLPMLKSENARLSGWV